MWRTRPTAGAWGSSGWTRRPGRLARASNRGRCEGPRRPGRTGSSSGCSEYFAGEDPSFEDVELDLEYETPFLDRCARALREIPRGEVVTYGELAALAGAPGAARAAGSFCARNRLGLFVPCHRVVGASGIGSYGSYGVEYKRRLLELEGAPI